MDKKRCFNEQEVKHYANHLSKIIKDEYELDEEKIFF